MALSERGMLGVGLAGGDGNLLALADGALLRTDPHPGRPRTSWLVRSSVEPNR